MRQSRAERRLHVGHQQRGADALARHVPDEQREALVGKREIIEEVAAHLTRRNGDALDLRCTETQRGTRQHLGLDLTGQFQLAPQPLLLDHQLLVPLEVLGHLVERPGERAELVAGADRHPSREITGGELPDARVER